MTNFGAWLGTDETEISAETRAVRAWRMIQRRPESITLIRGGTVQAAQTIRFDVTGGSTAENETVSSGRQSLLIFGVRDHPTVADTDIQRGDRFIYDDKEHEVTSVQVFPGQVQAVGEARE